MKGTEGIGRGGGKGEREGEGRGRELVREEREKSVRIYELPSFQQSIAMSSQTKKSMTLSNVVQTLPNY